MLASRGNRVGIICRSESNALPVQATRCRICASRLLDGFHTLPEDGAVREVDGKGGRRWIGALWFEADPCTAVRVDQPWPGNAVRPVTRLAAPVCSCCSSDTLSVG